MDDASIWLRSGQVIGSRLTGTLKHVESLVVTCLLASGTAAAEDWSDDRWHSTAETFELLAVER